MKVKNKINIKLLLKIMLIVFMIFLVCIIFVKKLYLIDEKVSVVRTIVPILFLLLFIVGLFYKPKTKLSDRNNFIVSMVISIFFIFFNFYLIQYAQGFSVFDIKWQFIILNIATLGVLLLVLFSISNSFKISILVMNYLTIILAFAEFCAVSFRGIGMLAVDVFNLETALNVANSYEYTLTYELFISIFIVIAITPLILLMNKNPFYKGKKRLIPIVITSIIVVFFIMGMNIDKVEKRIKVKYFKPQETFHKKGFPISYVRSIKDLVVKKPDGYSVKKVNELLKNYNSDKREEKDKPNIIVIMDEAYTDFGSMVDLKISEDPLPFIHSLDEDIIKGDLYVSIFGGGTSATEFEVLTNNSMAFVPNGINAYSAFINSPSPSLTSTLKDLGYAGLIAMHPYKPNGYSRSKVYPYFGFNNFISLNDFDSSADRLGRHISDIGDVDRIISEYEKSKKKSDKPFYLFNVTMQNHSPFIEPGIDDSIKLDYDMNIPEARQYFNKLRYTDKAVEKIINYYKEVDENTIIVFFGDHEPKLEQEFYDEIMKSYNKGEEYKNLEKYNTHFFIWANYDIEEKNDIKISANYLSNLILDTASLPKTGYNKFTSSIQEKVPVLTGNGYIGDNNKFYLVDDKKSPYYKELQRYNIIEYNNLFDVKRRVNNYYLGRE